MQSDRELRVVVVDEELPYPPNTGKRIRTYNLLSRLARRHRIEFLCHRNADEGEFDSAHRHFESLGISCRPIARKLPTQSLLAHGPGFYSRLAMNLLSPRPYLVDKHRSDAMQTAVREIDRKSGFDLWHCEWTPYAQYFGLTNGRPLVVSAHNVESLIWQRYHEIESNALKRWYIAKQWRKFLRFEKWAFHRAARTVAVSAADAQLAKKEFETVNVDVVENGVDTTYFSGTSNRRIPKRLLFVGSLDWRPNVDGIVQFLDGALPAIRRIEPDAHVQIVGRKPPQWLIDRVRLLENVELHADVADVRPYFDAASLMIVPLRVGGGSRLKILEAAAMRLPVVSTRVGAEGLRFDPGKHYVAAESVPEMVAPLLECLSNDNRCESIVNAAYQRVRELYDWDVLADKLERVWQRAVQPDRANRQPAAVIGA